MPPDVCVCKLAWAKQRGCKDRPLGGFWSVGLRRTLDFYFTDFCWNLVPVNMVDSYKPKKAKQNSVLKKVPSRWGDAFLGRRFFS